MRISILTALLFSVCNVSAAYIIEKPQTQQQLALALVYVDKDSSQAAQQIKKILESTGLFAINVQQGALPHTKKDITDYLLNGYATVLFIESDKKAISWRLYDATQAQMLLGKNSSSSSQELTARLVADAVYSHLFNHASYFLTKIACIKRSPTIRNKKRTELCILDPVTGGQETILRDNRILVAPQWGKFQADKKVWLTVSEFTPSNVRLLGADLQGGVWSIIDTPGTCVGTAQYNDSMFAYIRSGVLWLYEFDASSKKGRHTRLTDSSKTSACPSLTRSGDIIYSCNGKINRYDKATKKTITLPLTGNCLAPDTHAAKDRIVFSRSVNGTLQLHSADTFGNNVKQLTSGPGNKVDACWSPCGNYIAYTRTEKGREQIAVYNCMNHQEIILTPEHQQHGYPSWSEPSILLY